MKPLLGPQNKDTASSVLAFIYTLTQCSFLFRKHKSRSKRTTLRIKTSELGDPLRYTAQRSRKTDDVSISQPKPCSHCQERRMKRHYLRQVHTQRKNVTQKPIQSVQRHRADRMKHPLRFSADFYHSVNSALTRTEIAEIRRHHCLATGNTGPV